MQKRPVCQKPLVHSIVGWVERSTDQTGSTTVLVSMKTIAFAIRSVDRWVSPLAQPNLQKLAPIRPFFYRL